MVSDDRSVGTVLTRRKALALVAAAATGAAAHRAGARAHAAARTEALPDCVAQPEQTEGPYFVDKALERSDIRHDPSTGQLTPGSPLALQFVLSRIMPAGTCTVLPDARVDIWHCDASGVYSDVEDRYINTIGQQFLRGYQISDKNGIVRFNTIYPGWYPGRALHVHFKVRVPGANGLTDEFTSQLYFPDELTDRVHAAEPYVSHKGQRLLNSRDMIFREGATQLVLPIVETEQGYAATYRIAMRPGARRNVPFGRRRSG